MFRGLLCEMRGNCEKSRSGAGAGAGAEVSSHTAHVSSGEHTLQRPQHNHNEQHDECNEEHHPLPVCQPAQQLS